MPPPTPTSTSPARIAWSSRTVARRPEAQTLLMVSEETSFGMPAWIWAWREGIWPWPAWRTWPMITCWTCSGSTCARSRAAVIAVPPSSVASTPLRAPPILPIGVRAAPRMTVLGMPRILWWGDHATSSPTTQAPAATSADTDRRGAARGRGDPPRHRGRRAPGARRRRRGPRHPAPPRGHPRRREAVGPRRARPARRPRRRARPRRGRRRARPGPRPGRPEPVLGGPAPRRATTS